MGKFHLVYYISMGTPSIEASLQMAETYLAHGVSALQFDLPSRNPYRETLFIRKRMAKAWETYGGYEPVSDGVDGIPAQASGFRDADGVL